MNVNVNPCYCVLALAVLPQDGSRVPVAQGGLVITYIPIILFFDLSSRGLLPGSNRTERPRVPMPRLRFLLRFRGGLGRKVGVVIIMKLSAPASLAVPVALLTPVLHELYMRARKLLGILRIHTHAASLIENFLEDGI